MTALVSLWVRLAALYRVVGASVTFAIDPAATERRMELRASTMSAIPCAS